MRIEFNTIFDNFANEKLAHLYVKHFMEKQNKSFKIIISISIAVAVIFSIFGITLKQFHLISAGLFYALIVCLAVFNARKKALPKSFIETNKVGCPYNVTFGLYDEYFYEKYENNMTIQESSTRYEFLKKIVETPDSFILLTKRSSLYYLPKKDMGYENVLEFSAFCQSRLPYIYSFKN